MTVYVGLVTYNSLADLPPCLDALRAQTYENVRLLAWDNASSDQSAAWLRQHAPDVHLLTSGENVGYGRAHNTLIRTANLQPNDYYMALNPDAELMPDYIARLVAVLANQQEIGWATGKILQKTDGQPQRTNRLYSVGHGMLRSGFAFNIGYGLADGESFARDREVFGAPGAAVIYRAALIADVGKNGDFFDPKMFMYAEDTDVDWRARLRGWHCWYVADATALHRGSNPTGRLKMIAVANRYVSVLKNASLRDLLLYNLPLITGHCLIRLIVTPRLGVVLTITILRSASAAAKSRRRLKRERLSLREWYRWSLQQPTMQQSGWAGLRRWLARWK